MSTQFTVDIYQNEYLPEGGTEVNAIVTVTATGGFPAGGGPSAAAAEVIIIDTSGSMGYPASKMTAAKQATAAAIDTLRDGVAFAIIAGSHRAELVYPADGRLIAASAQTRPTSSCVKHWPNAPGPSPVTHAASAPTGWSPSCAPSPRRCSAPSTSSRIQPASPPTSRR